MVVITNDGTVNLRAGESTDYDVVATAKPGDTFDYLGTADSGWYKIRLDDGAVAYVSPKMAEIQN